MMQTMTSPLQWSNVILDLSYETFRKAFSSGREPGILMTVSMIARMLLAG
jgi:hypothetical protein